MLKLLSFLAFFCLTTAKPILFTNINDMKFFDKRLTLNINEPRKGPVVISPTKQWESWAILAYNSVLRAPDGQARMYYDCIEGDGSPPGEDSIVQTSYRRICLALSDDGLDWYKPALDIYNYTNPITRISSANNNILLEDSGVSVFIDESADPTERWKLITSYNAYSSADGISWNSMCQNKSTTGIDDTKPTAFYDPNEKAYVIYVRRDDVDYNRKIGRCVTDDLCDWEKRYHPNHCPIVFGVENGNEFDIYTNSYTPYPSIKEPSVHFFFPSIYYHFGSNPWGLPNDGLMDIQILESKDGENINFVGDTTYPYLALDNNNCGTGLQSKPLSKYGWCNPYTHDLKDTSFATSVVYMASGFLFSNDGTEIYQYASGQPFTHGGDAVNKTWGSNTGIRLLVNRKDGFTYVKAPYVSYDDYPFLVLYVTEIPVCDNGFMIAVNMETSVIGFVKVGIMNEKDYDISIANELKGASLSAIASWDGGRTFVVNGTKPFLMQVSLNAAKLYSVELKCFEN
jgi:hypothetical protein